MQSATRISPAFDDPDAVVGLIRSAGPFWPLINYAANDAELAALGSQPPAFVPPWFRQDFALLGETLVDGAEMILGNERFVEAARAVYGADSVVRPTSVYVNIMGPTPFPFGAHLDVPAFRGITRAEHPIWLLKTMKSSGLFEQWRTRIATAVSWFYDGVGGDFHYWPDGADGPARVESSPFGNVSVVADNESTFHGVAPLGAPGSTMVSGLTRDSRLVRGRRCWEARGADGHVITELGDDIVRITVSWKADVFADADEARRVDSGDGRLDLRTVIAVFQDDLARRGIDLEPVGDPLADREWIACLAATYPEGAPRLVAVAS